MEKVKDTPDGYPREYKALFIELHLKILNNIKVKALGRGGFDPPDDPNVKKWLY